MNNIGLLLIFQGITGHELCHYFWDIQYRMEWGGMNTAVIYNIIDADR